MAIYNGKTIFYIKNVLIISCKILYLLATSRFAAFNCLCFMVTFPVTQTTSQHLRDYPNVTRSLKVTNSAPVYAQVSNTINSIITFFIGQSRTSSDLRDDIEAYA